MEKRFWIAIIVIVLVVGIISFFVVRQHDLSKIETARNYFILGEYEKGMAQCKATWLSQSNDACYRTYIVFRGLELTRKENKTLDEAKAELLPICDKFSNKNLCLQQFVPGRTP